MRDQLNLPDKARDGWLYDEIAAATAAAEDFCWSRFITQTWKDYHQDFSDPIDLYYGPVASITSVQYVDTAGSTQTAGSSLYELTNTDGRPQIKLQYSQSWPAGRAHDDDDVLITYVVGYGAAAANVPILVRKAIKIYVAHAYWNREGDQPIPRQFYDLLRSYSFRRSRPVAA